jgi:hypothetical protein
MRDSGFSLCPFNGRLDSVLILDSSFPEACESGLWPTVKSVKIPGSVSKFGAQVLTRSISPESDVRLDCAESGLDSPSYLGLDLQISDLEFGLGIWTWNSDLEFGLGIRTWNLDLKFGLGIWTWNLDLEFGLGIWTWNSDLEFRSRFTAKFVGLEHHGFQSQTLILDCSLEPSSWDLDF